jgi:PAS domain S-box-containing protein
MQVATMRISFDRSPIIALTFPSEDLVFAERVRGILRDHPGGDVESAMATLRRGLAAVHPDVALSLRSEAIGFGDDPVVYVFRDGSALPKYRGTQPENEAGVARVVTDATGRYVDANEEAARLFGVTRAEIIGALAGTFTKPDARITDPDAIWRALSTAGRLQSLSVVQRPDGTDLAVEFVTERDGDGPGRHLTRLWPIASSPLDPANVPTR